MSKLEINGKGWINLTELSGHKVAVIKRLGKENAGILVTEAKPSAKLYGTLLSSTPTRYGDSSGDIWILCRTGHVIIDIESVNTSTGYLSTSTDVNNTALGGRKRSNIGTRMQFGRFGDFALNAGGNTFEMVAELPVDALAVQWIFANSMNGGGTTSSPAIVARTATIADFSDASIDAAITGGLTVTYNGLTTATLTAGAAQYRKKYTLSDWMPVVTTSKIIGCRTYVATSANPITISGNGSDVFSNWATRSAGRRIKMRKSDGNNVTTAQATFTSVATTANQNPIVGFRYISKTDIITVCAVGDSISEGRGTYLGEGFIMPACEAISTPDCIVEYLNLGFSSTPSSTFKGYLADLLAAGIYPDAIVYPNGSPNNISTDITANHITSAIGHTAGISAVNAASPKPAIEIMWTWMPTDTSVKAYGISDALRATYNAATLSHPRNGVVTFDAATPMSGVVSPNGQVQMVDGSTADHIHPNDYGNKVLLAPNLATVLRNALSLT